MMRRTARLLVFAAVAALTAGCGPSSAEVRYRVTVDIDDNGVTRSGSSVWSASVRRPTLALGSRYDSSFQGEAVAVELKDGRHAFALLVAGNGSDYASAVPLILFGDATRQRHGQPRKFVPSDHVLDMQDVAARVGELARIDCRETPMSCPMLVTFADQHDPKSVMSLVDEAGVSKDDRVVVTRIAVEITDAAVTDQIRPILSRIGIQKDRSLDNEFHATTSPTLAQRLNYSAFRRGFADEPAPSTRAGDPVVTLDAAA